MQYVQYSEPLIAYAYPAQVSDDFSFIREKRTRTI
jgi:hypothetical protein